MFSGIGCERLATPAISRLLDQEGRKLGQDCGFFLSLVRKGMQSVVMQSIVLLCFALESGFFLSLAKGRATWHFSFPNYYLFYCFANFLLCFQVKLG